MIRILVADDHFLIREGFKKLISKEADMEVVGEVSNASEVLKFLKEQACDLILLDISMPGKSGLDLIRDLEKWYPDVKILIVSFHPEDRYALRTLRTSASGYITKDKAPKEMIKAIRKVSKGKRYISEDMSDKIIHKLGPEKKGKVHDNLSDREFEILIYIGEGKSVSEIADKLGISVSTVNTYRGRILNKLNKKSNAELIHYAIKNDLVE